MLLAFNTFITKFRRVFQVVFCWFLCTVFSMLLFGFSVISTNCWILLRLFHISTELVLIAICLQLVNVAPLPPIIGTIRERIICLTITFLSVPTNSLHFCTVLGVPSMSSLIIPLCPSTAPPWPCLNRFSILSVTWQTTTSSPLLCVFLAKRSRS